MAEVIKIVLTGGPCAGKTTALHFLENKLEALNIPATALEECATKLMLSGKTPQNMGRYEFHKLLFESELKEEQRAAKELSALKCEKAVLLSDRGLLDNRAYVTKDEFDKYSSLYNLSEDVIRNSYDAVFHLVTAANGAEKQYNLVNNPIRSENLQKAREIDNKILSLWTGTPHLRVIDNSTSFDEKLERLYKEVMGFLGEPEPLEIERKFLIEYPNIAYLDNLPFCRRVPITQAYISTPDDGNFRIRRRGEDDNAVYIKTFKVKISDIKRIEKEEYITKEQSEKYLSDKKHISGIISKDRYCIVYNSIYYELDIYPFWNDRATLEIELLSESQKYELPPFVKLIREVSYEPEYRNFALAQKLSF